MIAMSSLIRLPPRVQFLKAFEVQGTLFRILGEKHPTIHDATTKMTRYIKMKCPRLPNGKYEATPELNELLGASEITPMMGRKFLNKTICPPKTPPFSIASLSPELLEFVGPTVSSRREVYMKICKYLRDNKLHIGRNNYKVDDKLRPIYGDRPHVHFSLLQKLLWSHYKENS